MRRRLGQLKVTGGKPWLARQGHRTCSLKQRLSPYRRNSASTLRAKAYGQEPWMNACMCELKEGMDAVLPS